MRNFPYKAIFICIFSPPVLYMITLLMLEGYLQKRETSRLNEIIIQNPQYLYDGQVTVQDEINRNVGEYLAQSILYKIGVRIHILIKTRDDRVLYPTSFQTSFQDIPAKTLDYTEVAAENYRILNKGLILTVDVNIRHNSWLSNSILVLYVILSVFIIQQLLKKRLRESEKEDREQKRVVEELSEQFSRTGAKLKEVKEREEEYIRNIEKLKQEKTTLSTDMDGLLDEMEKMETGLASQRALKEETESEILRLKEEIDQMKAKFQKPSKKDKKLRIPLKRFKVLYKNLIFTERAVEGFLSLSDELQLKAEEIIHKLDGTPNDDGTFSVPIKRKVFLKGGKKSFMEVVFSYSGRLYFQKDGSGKITVVSIGTKNTQEQDLAYLERMG